MAEPVADAAAPIISLDRVSKTFVTRQRQVEAVKEVTLDIRPGEVFGVIGYSGAGKSTLVRLINALEKANSGRITVDGQEVTSLGEAALNRLRARIGMVFQQFNLLSAKTVLANVAYPLKIAGRPKAEREARARELLDFVGIADKAEAYPSQLSGGQKQRVGIARALAQSPTIILADEATSALDPETTTDVLDLLRRVNRELGVTIVIITHDMEVVQYTCDRVAVMEEGQVVEVGGAYDVFAQPQHPATRRFIQTALHDRPSPDTVNRLRQRHPGRLVLASLTEAGSTSFNLSAATAGLQAHTAIVYGSISEVAGRPFGSVTLEVTGEDQDIAEVLDRLRQAGSQITDLGTAEAPLPDPLWALGAAKAEKSSDHPATPPLPGPSVPGLDPGRPTATHPRPGSSPGTAEPPSPADDATETGQEAR